MAARLLGVSLPSFNAIALAPVPYCRTHKRYFRETLELCLGRPITVEMVAAAEAAHAPRLATYRAANKARKEAHSHA